MILIVTVHAIIFTLNTIAIFYLPFKLGWDYWPVWLPIQMFLVRASYGHSCPCTMAENYARQRAGWPTIEGFTENYLWKWFR